MKLQIFSVDGGGVNISEEMPKTAIWNTLSSNELDKTKQFGSR